MLDSPSHVKSWAHKQKTVYIVDLYDFFVTSDGVLKYLKE